MKITELNNIKAKEFFLKEKNYLSADLPHYFTFRKLLNDVDKKIDTHLMKEFCSYKPNNFDNVNYLLLTNKDGHFGWRPIQLIHPVIYVSLVNRICEQNNWKFIVKRFKEYETSKVDCISILIQSESKESDKAENISNWYSYFENQSIKLGLEYQYMLKTDVVDCYSSIYTHSIAWALHGKEDAKKKKNNKNLIGNIIDKHIQDMSYGQTNGIPQGSVLMDFIAEIVLGYADEELTRSKNSDENTHSARDLKILRYRDDYRIFSNNTKILEIVIKYLTEVLMDLNLKINSSKTCISDNIIRDAIKPDKLFWINNKQIWNIDYQKKLYYLHSFAESFPNSGSLVKLLVNFYKNINIKFKKSIRDDIIVMSSIVTDIMYKNPRVYPQCIAILSKLLDMMNTDKAKDIVNLIIKRLEYIPNTTLLNIWLQRITYRIDATIPFKEKLCEKVINRTVNIWESSWLKDDLKKLIDEADIINQEALNKLSKVVNIKEIQLFNSY